MLPPHERHCRARGAEAFSGSTHRRGRCKPWLMNANKPIVVVSTKSPGIAILLTILFGPIGMFYSTIPGAIIMCLVSLVVGVLTLGVGLVLIWPICILWAALAARAYNKRILSQVR